MGAILSEPYSTYNFQINVNDPDKYDSGDKITKIEIFADGGNVILYNTFNSHQVYWNISDSSITYTYYFIKITALDGQRAWTAPIWTGN